MIARAAASAEASPPNLSDFFTTRYGRLAIGLLAVELMAAMQLFTIATLLPQVGHDLNGTRWFGVIIAVGTVAGFITMPLAGPAMERLGTARLLALLSPVYVTGTLVSSLAPTIAFFAVGRLIQGLAAGALATASLGAVAAVLPGAWRPRVVALTSSMWVLPALFGPTYASSVASVSSWRWAVGLLAMPMLVVRFYVARQLRGLPSIPVERSPLRIGASLGLALAVGLVLVGSAPTLGRVAIAALGLLATLVFARQLLPKGTFRLRRGRRAALAALAILCFTFYAGDDVISVIVTYGLHGSIRAAALALTAGALCWAVASIFQAQISRHVPVQASVRLGAGCLCAGLIGIAVLLLLDRGGLTAWAAAGCWAVVGLGMGLAYSALLVRLFADDEDSLTGFTIASAVVLAEALAGGVGGTLSGTAVSAWTSQPLQQSNAAPAIIFGSLAICAVGLGLVAARLPQRTAPRGSDT